MNPLSLIHPLLALALAPLMPGVIQRTQAIAAGRRGPPMLQLYYDIWRNVQKGAVYSRTTSWLFRAGPVAGLAAVVAALGILPFAGVPAVLAFRGDFFLFAYLLGLMRFVMVLAALDTGSSFEGMGASREVQFSALAEPAFLLGLAAIAKAAGGLSLSTIGSHISTGLWVSSAPALALAAAALFVVFLAENARMPIDDPNTHLELTMVHEVMVLDHCGPDFAMIQYGASLKLWAFGSILMGVVVPVRTGNPAVDVSAALAGMLLLCIIVGTIASCMARLPLLRVPQLLVGAGALSAIALVLVSTR